MKVKITIYTAAAIVIANMIGTGVFTSLGFQLAAVQNTWTIVLLWTLGGIFSLFGAFAYAELGTHFKVSGGDYIFLSRIFHPLAGYLSAWAGLTVGFSAPVALAAMAFTKYMAPFGLQGNRFVALAIIIVIGLMHSFTVKNSSRFQNISTLLKVIFILVLIVIGVAGPGGSNNAFVTGGSWKNEVVSTGFAVSMIYVGFAYTGWNAAAYIVDELKNPSKDLPKALIASTLFVTIAYVLFQLVLLKHAGIAELTGKEEVTFISFNNLLGANGGKWVSICIALQLVATISSYLWVGPRVTASMAEEFSLWRKIAKRNNHGIPVRATWLYVGIAILLTLTGSFEQVLLYSGFVLQLTTTLTVAGSLFLKEKASDRFKMPLRPWLQIIFLLFSLWVLIFTFIDKPKESLIGIGIIALGAVLYYFDKPVNNAEAII